MVSKYMCQDLMPPLSPTLYSDPLNSPLNLRDHIGQCENSFSKTNTYCVMEYDIGLYECAYTGGVINISTPTHTKI